MEFITEWLSDHPLCQVPNNSSLPDGCDVIISVHSECVQTLGSESGLFCVTSLHIFRTTLALCITVV